MIITHGYFSLQSFNNNRCILSSTGSTTTNISTKRLIIESSSSSRRSSVADDDRDKGEVTNGNIVEWKPSQDQDDEEETVDDDKHVTKHAHPVSPHSDSTLDGDEVIEVVSSPATPTAPAAAIGQNESQEEDDVMQTGSPTISQHSNASDYETEDAVTPPVSPAHMTSHDQGGDGSGDQQQQQPVVEESTTDQASMDTTTDSQESSQEVDEQKEQKVTASTAAKTKWDEYVNDMVKRIEENESDCSDEDSSPTKRVYLLSRTYHQIWNVSDYFNKRFLLEPAPGMEWSRSSKRPPLFDCDPQVQAAYYRKWAQPTIIQCCEHCVLMSTSKKLVRSLGNVEKSGDRRFLLTGPAQVSCIIVCVRCIRVFISCVL